MLDGLLLGQLADARRRLRGTTCCDRRCARGSAESERLDDRPQDRARGPRARRRRSRSPRAARAKATAQRPTTVPVATASGKPSGDLTISNWALYIDKKTIPEFEQATGVNVDYVEDINSYDEFFGKMQPLLDKGESGGRSLMVANDPLAKRMYHLGYLQRLDQRGARSRAQAPEPVASQGSDAAHDYSIPWQGGMTGLIVNKDLAPDVHSVNDLFDPKYKGKVEMITELREVVPLVMKAEGIDPLPATEQDWLDTIDKLKAGRRQSGQIRRFTGGDYARDLATGDAVAVDRLGGRRLPATGRQPETSAG